MGLAGRPSGRHPGGRHRRRAEIVLEQAARRVLQLWTPLLALVIPARGDIDGMVGYHAEEIDLPAGALIAAEAGVAMYGLDGAPFDERIGRPQVDRSSDVKELLARLPSTPC